MIDLDKFMERIQETKKAAKDIPVDMKDLQVNGPSFLAHGEETMAMSSWAFSQLCTRIDVPTSYVKRCPPDLLNSNVNYWLDQSEKKAVLRTLEKDGEDPLCRAVVSRRYAAIDDADVMPIVLESNIGLSFDSADIDDRHTIVYMSKEKKETQQEAISLSYDLGMVVRNSEVGAMSLGIACAMKADNFVYQSARFGLSRKHMGSKEVIKDMLNEFAPLLEDFIGAAEREIAASLIYKIDGKQTKLIIEKMRSIFGKRFIAKIEEEVKNNLKEYSVYEFAKYIMQLNDQTSLDPQQETRAAKLAGALIGILTSH